MEFYQFHPTALRMEGVPTFLISEAMRGEGAVLRNAGGQPFMAGYHPLGDLAPRDVVARAIFREMEKSDSDQVFLDVTHLDGEAVRNRFPTIYRFCLDHGLDITVSPIPVAPAAHYMMGGIKTNTWGETTIDGLYAAGEVACTRSTRRQPPGEQLAAGHLRLRPQGGGAHPGTGKGREWGPSGRRWPSSWCIGRRLPRRYLP